MVMQVPTYPDGRRGIARSGGRDRRPIVAEPGPLVRARPSGAASRSARGVLVSVVLAFAAVACSVGTHEARQEDDLGGLDLGGVTTTAVSTTVAAAPLVTLPEGFVLPDTRTVMLPPVEGRPKEEVDHSKPLLPVRGGEATLRGTVFGPDGPLEGATVRLERFVGDDFGREDIATNGDGRWEAKGLIGGRYKVRAWARPDLATVEPQAAFVANKEGEATLDMTVEKFEGEQLQGALDVADPAVGQIHVLRVLVSRIEVNEEGIVGGVGLEGREVELVTLGGIRVVGEKKAKTDVDGFAELSLVCMVAGVHGVTLRSGDLSTDVELPECADGTFDGERLPPELPDFPVGTTFNVPSAGPYPAGTYVATTPGNCGISFQEFIGDRWASNVSLDRTISPTNPIRNVSSVPGRPACTYRRSA
jgi:hypothetical protein